MMLTRRHHVLRTLSWLGAVAAIGAGVSAEAAPLLHAKARHSLGPKPEAISFLAGPCQGGSCAVYRVAVHSNGIVTFEGLAHTSVMGTSTRTVGRSAYQEFASSLSPYRPRGRGQDTACLTRASDQPTYKITWTGRGGASTLEHNLGCSSPRDNVLNAILTNAPAQFGIDAWTAPQDVAGPAAVIKPHIFYF